MSIVGTSRAVRARVRRACSLATSAMNPVAVPYRDFGDRENQAAIATVDKHGTPGGARAHYPRNAWKHVNVGGPGDR